MDTAQWHQDIGLVKPTEELVTSISGAAASNSSKAPQVMERTRVRPQKEQALNCPRCNSTNTKFCYYNNYSLTQPRYFCKTCRRYWTEGGSLRNVPVGGGSRKNKRSSALSSSTAATTAPTSTSSSSAAAAAAAASVAISNASKKLSTDHHLLPPAISLSTVPSQAPTFHDGQDLNLAFPHHSHPAEFSDFANLDSTSASNNNSSSSNRSNSVNALSAIELLRNGMSGRSLGPFMQMPMAMPEYPAGFGLQEFRRSPLSFPLDGIGAGDGAGSAGGYGSMQGVQESDGGGRMLFPFEDLKQVVPSSTAPDQFEQSRVQTGDPPGFWNGMIGGSGSW